MQLFITCLVLTGLHATFVMAEYSMVKTSHAGRGDEESFRYSSSLSHIHDQLEDYLLVCQIGKTGALIGIGIFLGRFFFGIEPGAGGAWNRLACLLPGSDIPDVCRDWSDSTGIGTGNSQTLGCPAF